MLGHHVEGSPQLAQRHPRHVIWYTHIHKHTHTPCDWLPVHTSEGQVWDFVDGESTQNTTLAVGLEGKAHIWILSKRKQAGGFLGENNLALQDQVKAHKLQIPLAEGARKYRTGIPRDKVLRESKKVWLDWQKLFLIWNPSLKMKEWLLLQVSD